jgi:hypothetical protein
MQTTAGIVFGAYNAVTGYFQNVRSYKMERPKSNLRCWLEQRRCADKPLFISVKTLPPTGLFIYHELIKQAAAVFWWLL